MQLGTMKALLTSLDLVRDDAIPPIPFESYEEWKMLSLRSSLIAAWRIHTPWSPELLTIRIRLLDMAVNDRSRRLSAWALLGQIEWWRLEYGRPIDELRHPFLESGDSGLRPT